MMTREELIALASPPCRECGEPVQRVEVSWHLSGETWRAGWFMVCAAEHRVAVETV